MSVGSRTGSDLSLDQTPTLSSWSAALLTHLENLCMRDHPCKSMSGLAVQDTDGNDDHVWPATPVLDLKVSVDGSLLVAIPYDENILLFDLDSMSDPEKSVALPIVPDFFHSTDRIFN